MTASSIYNTCRAHFSQLPAWSNSTSPPSSSFVPWRYRGSSEPAKSHKRMVNIWPQIDSLPPSLCCTVAAARVKQVKAGARPLAHYSLTAPAAASWAPSLQGCRLPFGQGAHPTYHAGTKAPTLASSAPVLRRSTFPSPASTTRHQVQRERLTRNESDVDLRPHTPADRVQVQGLGGQPPCGLGKQPAKYRPRHFQRAFQHRTPRTLSLALHSPSRRTSWR